MQASLFPGEEDIETWSFGERTLDAVLTFQVYHLEAFYPHGVILKLVNKRPQGTPGNIPIDC